MCTRETIARRKHLIPNHHDQARRPEIRKVPPLQAKRYTERLEVDSGKRNHHYILVLSLKERSFNWTAGLHLVILMAPCGSVPNYLTSSSKQRASKQERLA